MLDLIDFAVENHGSIYLVRPLTEAAQEHADEVYAEAMTFGGAVAVEHRYADHNISLLLSDGFRVSLDGDEVELS